MDNLSELIFGNMFLIITFGLIAYIIVQFKDLSTKRNELNVKFSKVLEPYLGKKIAEARATTDSILKEYGREDEISTEISRLLLTIEKAESKDLNDIVKSSNAINKFKLNQNVDLERYPSLKKLQELGTFNEKDLSSFDNGIALARKEYNTLAFRYNQKAGGFPLQYLTKLFGFKDHYVIFDPPKSENYEEEYEVFEEEEPEINLITSLNQQERKSDKEQNNKTIKEEQQDFVMEHSDIILKPSKNLTTLTDKELPSLKQKNE